MPSMVRPTQPHPWNVIQYRRYREISELQVVWPDGATRRHADYWLAGERTSWRPVGTLSKPVEAVRMRDNRDFYSMASIRTDTTACRSVSNRPWWMVMLYRDLSTVAWSKWEFWAISKTFRIIIFRASWLAAVCIDFGRIVLLWLSRFIALMFHVVMFSSVLFLLIEVLFSFFSGAVWQQILRLTYC